MDYIVEGNRFTLMPGDILLISPLDLHRPDPRASERTYQLDILIDNDIAVFFLDGREALSTRIYKMPQMPWGFYVADGTAVFQNITMRMLKG